MTTLSLEAPQRVIPGSRDANGVRFNDAHNATVGEGENPPVVYRIDDGLQHDEPPLLVIPNV